MHTTKSGVAHFSYHDERSCLLETRKLLEYLPQNNRAPLPKASANPCDRCGEIGDIVPQNSRKPYDVHKVIDTMIDVDSFFEIQKDWAKNVIIGLSRIDDKTVGIIVDQLAYLGGSLHVDS